MESIDLTGRSRAKADMGAATLLHPRHALAQIDPELRIGFAEADRGRPRHQTRKPERRQGRPVESRGAFEVANADGDVVDHLQGLGYSPSLRGAQRRSNPFFLWRNGLLRVAR